MQRFGCEVILLMIKTLHDLIQTGEKPYDSSKRYRHPCGRSLTRPGGQTHTHTHNWKQSAFDAFLGPLWGSQVVEQDGHFNRVNFDGGALWRTKENFSAPCTNKQVQRRWCGHYSLCKIRGVGRWCCCTFVPGRVGQVCRLKGIMLGADSFLDGTRDRR